METAPEAVVVDTKDGYTYSADSGGLFTLEAARAFASQRNAEFVSPERRTLRVFRLTADTP